MGDTANKHFTKFLIEKGLWTPPPTEKRTQHDVLLIVFKLPGRDEPYVHQFDDKYVDELSISHPEYPEVSKLGHRGGPPSRPLPLSKSISEELIYGCMPFNGWFARCLVHRKHS
jgi:nitric oxide synthase oxygenase domain/subunit